MNRHLTLLKRVVDLPTAPFVEGHVAAFVREFVAQRSQLRLKRDRFGNLLVKYAPKGRARKPVSRPILFAAHMDHPGFVAREMVDGKHVEAEWHGGVKLPFFVGSTMRFHVDGAWVRGTIEKVIVGKRKKGTPKDAPPQGVIIRVAREIPRGSLGMWNLPDATIRGHRLHARVTDDLSGLAAILCTLDEICRRKSKTPTYAFFTRAEEVGFAGALAAVEAKTAPAGAIVVAVENSSVLPGVSLGAGPILRVGDRMSVFTPMATAYCQVVAEQVAKKDKSFKYQRKLMDGGSCESTAYCHYGYDATGICLALVNYHNMDVEKKRIAPESVDVRDFLNLVKWFVALAESPAKMKPTTRSPAMHKKLEGLRKKYIRRLEA